MKKKTDTKRQAILDVAAEVFRESGFQRALMSEICARLGGSKATLYNYFSSKEELFFEVLVATTEAQHDAVLQALAPSTGDIAESLRNFGEKFLTFIYSPPVRAQRHVAISESGRKLGHLIYERGVLGIEKLIAEFLQTAMQQGQLRQADPMIATKHLNSLLESELLNRLLFQQLGDVSEAEIRAVTARAIAVFMAAYAPQQTTTP